MPGRAANVNVQGNKKGGWRDAFPKAHVNGAFPPYKPAQGQVQAFAGRT